MKADPHGTPGERLRAALGWRTAEKGEERCDACQYSNIGVSGNGGPAPIRCKLADVSTRAAATCEKPAEFVRVYEMRQQAGWRSAWDTDFPTRRCQDCHFLGDNGDGPGTHCFHLDVPTTKTHVCNDIDAKTLIDTLDGLTGGDALSFGLDLDPAEPMTDPTENLPARPQTGGDIELYDRRRVVGECKFYMSQSAEAMLEAGRRLIQLKENEPHGDFERILKEQLNLEPRTARLMMSAATKFLSPQFESNRKSISDLGKTKLFTLMTEDDGDLVELFDGGTLAGKTLDEIDRMTNSELKAALRTARQDSKAALEKAQADLKAARAVGDQYATQLREEKEKTERIRQHPELIRQQADEYEKKLLDEVIALVPRIRVGLLSRCLAVADSHDGPDREHGRLLIAQALGQIISEAKVIGRKLEITPDANPPSVFADLDHAGDSDGERTTKEINAGLDLVGRE